MSAPAAADWPEPYEGYYLYLYDDGGDYPSLANPGWHEEVQGITHDDNNWFITQKWALWKVSVNLDLAAPGTPNVTPGLYRIHLDDVPELVGDGYNHFGDLSYYEFEGQGYLVISIEIINGDKRPGVAVFTASTLQYVDHALVWGQGDAPWCAVDPQGNLYTSGQGVSTINRFSVDWSTLKATGTLVLGGLPSLTALDESGNVLTLGGTQGGVISPSGELLYVVADGIHVLDVSTGRRVQASTNGYGHFNYHFDPGGWPDDMEEPEGITIWDLDGAGAPGISGQLHALMLDNDWPSADEVTIEHYTNDILVDGSYTGPEDPDKNGTPSYPFRTVTDACNLAWNGARIKIKAGTYSETPTFSKRIQVFATGGTATIGTGGRVSLSPSAAINLAEGGMLRLY